MLLEYPLDAFLELRDCGMRVLASVIALEARRLKRPIWVMIDFLVAVRAVKHVSTMLLLVGS